MDEYGPGGVRIGDRVSSVVGATGAGAALVLLGVSLLVHAPVAVGDRLAAILMLLVLCIAVLCDLAGVYYGRISRRSYDREARRIGLAAVGLAALTVPLALLYAVRFETLLG